MTTERFRIVEDAYVIYTDSHACHPNGGRVGRPAHNGVFLKRTVVGRPAHNGANRNRILSPTGCLRVMRGAQPNRIAWVPAPTLLIGGPLCDRLPRIRIEEVYFVGSDQCG